MSRESRTGAMAKKLLGLVARAPSPDSCSSTQPELTGFLQEVCSAESSFGLEATDLEHGKAILRLPAREKATVACEVAKRFCDARNDLSTKRSLPTTDLLWRSARLLKSLLSALLRSDLPFGDADIAQLIDCVSSPVSSGWVGVPLPGVLRAVERYAQQNPLSPAHRTGLEELLATPPLREQTADGRKLRARVSALVGSSVAARQVRIEAGEPWADRATGDLSGLAPNARDALDRLLDHAKSASGSKPSGVWLKRARQLIDPIGTQVFLKLLDGWCALVGQPGEGRPMRGYVGVVLNPTVISEANADILKGLAWCAGAVGDPSASRMLADLAEVCFKKIPVHGARCPRVGNACLAALNLLPGPQPVGELSRLSSRVKQPSVRAAVEKAINKSAQALGVSREEVEEMSTPTYGLSASGTMIRQLGSFSADLSVVGTCEVAIRWTGAGGKTVKSVPTEVKRDHAESLKELLRTQKDLQKMLPAQAQRIERLLREQRDCPVDVWRQRYLDHPLLSNLSHRLIWQFAGPREAQAIWSNGRPVCSDGSSFSPPGDARVRLWHPIDSPAEAVLAWRRWLEEHRVTQPFKQAHRELYILTDAERQTNSYSNRFAAHILRQHQFAALCQARGWKYRLMGDFDSHNTPTLELPRHGLRAEFWVEQPANDELSPSGINLRIANDQVRFYRAAEREPLPLDQIAPRIFSEVMRDVDLFVGVASVGNDPTWQDGGPEHRFQGYWHQVSFGELSATAQTRRAVLESLLPRLTKIRDRCSLSDRFLVVRGDIRTYRIHLGSGNIMMEPNDQYLCIVPSRSSAAPADVFLPFEGDATFSIILSKAFLLAEDKKIKDPTITRQIGSHV